MIIARKILFLAVLFFTLTALSSCATATQKTIWDVEVEQAETKIESFTREIKRDPSNPELYVRRGKVYIKILKINEAIADYNKALEINPSYTKAYEGRAEAYELKALDILKFDPKSVKLVTPTDEMKAEIKKYNEMAESDRRRTREIDPAFFKEDENRGLGYLSEDKKDFVFPVLDDTKKLSEGKLVLGKSTMKETVEMLPPWPGYGPKTIKALKKPISDKVDKAMLGARYSYNPMVAGNHSFAFDENKKLIYIHVHLSMANSPDKKERQAASDTVKRLESRHDFKEISRDQRLITLRTEIMPCVSADILKPLNPRSVPSNIIYYYTCPTK